MLNRIAEGRPVDPNFSKYFKVKRAGKDKNDTFWNIGKIHGLENVAFVDAQALSAAAGNPWRIQKLVDTVNDNPKPLPPQNFDRLVESVHNKMG